MVRQNLHKHSHGVVHRGKHRTRLRVPRKYRNHETMRKVQTSIEKIAGVQSVSINSDTGSVLVHHQEVSGLLDEIGSALAESAPDILASMLVPEGAEGLEILTTVFQGLFSLGAGKAVAQGNGGTAGHQPASLTARKALPMALIAAGAWKLLQEEALLGGLAPLALFYYGFDLHWKLQQESRTEELERLSIEQAGSPSSSSPKQTREHA